MPRPAKRKQTVIVTVAMELELARKLSALAREYGVSRSELIERLIIEALGPRALEPAKPQIPSDPLSPSETAEGGQQDPLLQLEVEEFESKLSRLERKVGELEQVVGAVAKGHFVRTGFEPHREQLLNRAFKLIKDWHEQRRWLYRLKRDLPREKASEFSRRMADLKKRLNAMLELLGYEGGR
jgi:predicted RNase H-like nuclease (RuvC/YqgF family)